MSKDGKKYSNWVISEYSRIININRLQEKIKKNKSGKHSEFYTMLDEKYKYPMEYRLSSMRRYENLASNRHHINIIEYEYICIPLHVIRTIMLPNNHSINYKAIYAYIYVNIKTKKPDFISYGYTFMSADGEYRPIFTPYESIIKIIKNNDFVLMNDIEKKILDEISSKKILLEYNIVDEKYKKIIEHIISQDNIIYILYVICYIFTLSIMFINNMLFMSPDVIEYDLKKKINFNIYSHINLSYIYALFDTNEKTYSELLNIKPPINLENIEKMIKYIQKYITIGYDSTLFRSGVKMSLLNITDIQNIGDNKYKIWKEIDIGYDCSNLVLNNISPCFPIINDYFIIKGNNESMYDNEINLLKIQHSNTVEKIVAQLESSRKLTMDRDNVYISAKFEGLSDIINLSMEYAEKNIALSGYSICVPMETLGETYQNINKNIHLMSKSWVYNDAILFQKYIFEIIYSLYNMNAKLGLVHGDLHINNATIFHKDIFAVDKHDRIWIAKNTIIYEIDENIYLFPHTGCFSGIIDFSRSISIEDINKSKKTINNKLKDHFPEYYKENISKIKALIELQYKKMFRIMSITDILRFSKQLSAHLSAMISNNNNNDISVYDYQVLKNEILPFIDNMYKICYNFITSNINNLFNDSDINIEWPNLTLIQQLYSSNSDKYISIFKNVIFDEFMLSDYYSTNNKMTNDIRFYDKFPEISKFDHLIKYNIIPTKELNKYKLSAKLYAEKKYDNKYEKYMSKIGDQLSYQIRNPI